MKRFLIFSLLILSISACTCGQKVTSVHPDWTYNTVVYEMNVRQSTPEGTFAAAEGRLPALKELGVDILWLMPIYPIGVKERKGTLGSYYAISDYEAVNPEFGTMDDFDAFLKKAHNEGFKVILDWVANHTSPDAKWIDQYDWYLRDSLGKTLVRYDWTDIAELNYDNRDMRRAMTDAMRFWLARGVDGFRCDVAQEVPIDYWREAFAELKADYPNIYLLAEGEAPELHVDAFDASYGWEVHHIMNGIAQGKKSVADLKEYIARDAVDTPKEAFRLMFTSNHDENSWNGTEFERMGDAARTFAALTYVLPNGQPLIYTGQEVGFDRRLQFFEKDSIDSWEPNAYTQMYTKLNAMRHANSALAAGERGARAEYLAGMPETVLAFVRANDEDTVLSIFNLSVTPVEIKYPAQVAGEYTDAMSGDKVTVRSDDTISLGAWAFMILTK